MSSPITTRPCLASGPIVVPQKHWRSINAQLLLRGPSPLQQNSSSPQIPAGYLRWLLLLLLLHLFLRLLLLLCLLLFCLLLLLLLLLLHLLLCLLLLFVFVFFVFSFFFVFFVFFFFVFLFFFFFIFFFVFSFFVFSFFLVFVFFFFVFFYVCSKARVHCSRTAPPLRYLQVTSGDFFYFFFSFYVFFFSSSSDILTFGKAEDYLTTETFTFLSVLFSSLLSSSSDCISSFTDSRSQDGNRSTYFLGNISYQQCRQSASCWLVVCCSASKTFSFNWVFCLREHGSH